MNLREQQINQGVMLSVGSILRGVYRIDKYLSSGGFGNTYVATNIEFDEIYAIKEFFIKGVTQRDVNHTLVSVSNTENKNLFEEQLNKFKKEARRLRKMDNQHVVAVHDLFEENGTAYYVMDFIDGENLSERLRRLRHALSENEVMTYLPQILEALESIHKKGLWHLDLKPANIMVDKMGNIKLIDFGASKQHSNVGGAATSTSVSFTKGYAPREQMEQNTEKFGPWTDFYALGATLYNLLTNKKPPLPSDIDDDISDDKHEALPLLNNVSDEMHKCILWLMDTNRSRRPQNVEDIKKRFKLDKAKYGQKDVLNIINNGIIVDEETIIDNNISEVSEDFEETIKRLLTNIQLGDEESLNELIDFFYDENVLTKDKNTAFGLLYYTTDKNISSIQLIIGLCYSNGEGVNKDKKEAYRWYQKAALQGDAEAQNRLGLCFFDGEGVDEDKIEAVGWFRKAAEQDNSNAQYFLGLCYSDGIGVQKDKLEAVRWYRKAAEQEDANAQSSLGLYYFEGDGVPMDKKEAVYWFRKASEQDDVVGQYFLGLCYYNGDGIQEDKAESVRWFQKAAVQEDNNGISACAQNFLGLCYFYGEGVPEDKSEAVRWFQKAANQGDSDAQLNLGDCYYNGDGVKEDKKEAVRFFRMAANQGEVSALYNLGLCYYDGDGVKEDKKEAVRLFRKAAIQEDARAQYYLGLCYYNGEGVPKNKKEAIRWFREAAEQGNEAAQYGLENLLCNHK